jgi:hypothetical protein
VYALLHRREMFAKYAGHEFFLDCIVNIEAVVEFFQDKLEGLSGSGDTIQVLEEIELASKSWIVGVGGNLPKVKFGFEHGETEAARFFLAFTWSVIYQHSLLHWKEDCKALWLDFDAEGGVEEALTI